MTVVEAAKLMQVDPQFLRLALQQKLFPFGVAVKCDRRYSYFVNEKMLEEYLRGSK
jgi:hypothetical protein